MINYYCGGFYDAEDIYEKFFQLKEKSPYIFYNNVKLSKIFGSFPNMVWNGGGYSFGEMPLIEEIEQISINYYYKDIPLLLTCTNPCLEKTDIYDRYCNTILSILDNGKNEIMVSSPYLEEYIRKNYPNYKINKSIIASEFDYDLNEALNNYNTVVLPRRYAKDFNYLNNSIALNNRHRVEILCNDPCPIDCPYLYSHYKEFGKTQMYQKSIYCSEVDCKMPFRKQYPWERDKSQIITYDEIVEKYLPLGYTEFKISGRNNINHVIYNLVNYFIKPEYQTQVFLYLLEE